MIMRTAQSPVSKVPFLRERLLELLREHDGREYNGNLSAVGRAMDKGADPSPTMVQIEPSFRRSPSRRPH